jgi:uncharacterized membrane protein
LHLATVVPAFFIGATQLMRRKGTPSHRLLGKVYNVPIAYIAARRRNIKVHRGAMIGLYVGGILIAGAFAFSPGRMLHEWLFG